MTKSQKNQKAQEEAKKTQEMQKDSRIVAQEAQEKLTEAIERLNADETTILEEKAQKAQEEAQKAQEEAQKVHEEAQKALAKYEAKFTNVFMSKEGVHSKYVKFNAEGATSAIHSLEKGKNEADYAIAYLMNQIKDSEGFKILGYENLEKYAEAEFDYSKGYTYKLCRIAEKFIQLKEGAIALIADTNAEGTALANVHTDVKSFNVLTDKFGFKFTISQLNEMLTCNTEAYVNILTTLIRDGKITRKTSASDIREILKEALNKPSKKQDNKKADGEGTDGEGTENAKMNKPTNDKQRIQSILDIVAEIESTEITEVLNNNNLIEVLENALATLG